MFGALSPRTNVLSSLSPNREPHLDPHTWDEIDVLEESQRTARRRVGASRCPGRRAKFRRRDGPVLRRQDGSERRRRVRNRRSAKLSTSAAIPQTTADTRLLAAENGMNGSTGLLHTMAADSGAAGTFRMSLLGSYYTGSGFLCPLCESISGKVLPAQKDKVRQVGTRVQLSATPIDFLEAYVSMRFQTTSDDQGDPKSIEIVGDTTLGLKAFTPSKPDHVFTFGGGADILFLNSPGGVGLDAASVGLHALGTADLTRQAQPESRVPLRFNLNFGYLFDGSGNLADDIEKSRAQEFGNRPRITRVERFGHDINRVDSFNLGLGVEGVFPWIRPFAEWTIDIPVNRQGYDCGNTTNRSTGDGCLDGSGFTAVPSRLTLGARVYPWVSSWMNGLAFLAAVDIGTGATGTFIEEVSPELPWAIHVGVAYAVDVAQGHGATRVVEKIVERAAPVAPERHIEGIVTRAGKGEPIAGAIIRYVGRPLTGMVADDQGAFRTMDLDPGEYRFAVTATDFPRHRVQRDDPEPTVTRGRPRRHPPRPHQQQRQVQHPPRPRHPQSRPQRPRRRQHRPLQRIRRLRRPQVRSSSTSRASSRLCRERRRSPAFSATPKRPSPWKGRPSRSPIRSADSSR